MLYRTRATPIFRCQLIAAALILAASHTGAHDQQPPEARELGELYRCGPFDGGLVIPAIILERKVVNGIAEWRTDWEPAESVVEDGRMVDGEGMLADLTDRSRIRYPGSAAEKFTGLNFHFTLDLEKGTVRIFVKPSVYYDIQEGFYANGKCVKAMVVDASNVR